MEQARLNVGRSPEVYTAREPRERVLQISFRLPPDRTVSPDNVGRLERRVLRRLPMAGRVPRSYRRPDAMIIDAVVQALAWALVLVLLLAFVLPATVEAVDYNIYSSPGWDVSNATGTNLGTAQNVCLAAGWPASCPAGATQYGYTPANLWTAPLINPSATWIWSKLTSASPFSPITGLTSPAALQEFTLSTQFYMCAPPDPSKPPHHNPCG